MFLVDFNYYYSVDRETSSHIVLTEHKEEFDVPLRWPNRLFLFPQFLVSISIPFQLRSQSFSLSAKVSSFISMTLLAPNGSPNYSLSVYFIFFFLKKIYSRSFLCFLFLYLLSSWYDFYFVCDHHLYSFYIN